jgi:hypothetical protein
VTKFLLVAMGPILICILGWIHMERHSQGLKILKFQVLCPLVFQKWSRKTKRLKEKPMGLPHSKNRRVPKTPKGELGPMGYPFLCLQQAA